MSLTRALTKRVKRSDAPFNRLDSIRYQISSPVALVSTTNMLSYNAPDIADAQRDRDHPQPSPSSAPSTPTRSSIDIDSGASTPLDDSTDATSVDSSPTTGLSPSKPFFESFPSTPQPEAAPSDDMPALPARALSHSKREHERLAKKRSIRLSRPSSSQSNEALQPPSSIDLTRNSTSSSSSNSGPHNPFSNELEQLNEVAEEFGAAARDAALHEDLAVMQTRGLAKYTVFDYLQVIQPFWDTLWEDDPSDTASEIWI